MSTDDLAASPSPSRRAASTLIEATSRVPPAASSTFAVASPDVIAVTLAVTSR